MSFVVSHLGREIIEIPKLVRGPEVLNQPQKPPPPPPKCRQCGGPVLVGTNSENNEFETIKLGDIFTQFSQQGQDSNNSSTTSTSTSSQSELCSQCITVNSVSSLGDEAQTPDELDQPIYNYRIMKVEPEQPESSFSPRPPGSSSIIISTATSVITLQTSHNNNNEPLSQMYYDQKPIIDQKPVMVSNELLEPKIETTEEFMMGGHFQDRTDSSYPDDNDNQDMLTNSLDDHSELIIIKPGPAGPDFHTQYTPPPSQPNPAQLYDGIPAVPPSINSEIQLTSPASIQAPPKVYSCVLCSINFKNKRLAKAHRERVHDKLARYFCDTCGGAFSYRGSLDSHVASHHPPVVTFVCPSCGKSFKEKSSLSAHFTIVHSANPRRFKCEFCSSAFSKKVNLNYHRKRKHPQQVLDSANVSSAAMNTHPNPHSTTPTLGLNGNRPNSVIPVSVVQSGAQYQVPQTNLDTVSSIIESIASNTDIIPAVPPPPPRTMVNVNTEGEFKCDYCGKGFQFRNNLKAHLKTHTREKAYTCSLCEKSFVYKESLKNHMLLHSGQFPYNCNICNKKFRDRSNRRKHVKNVHKVPLPNGAPLPVSITSTEPFASTSVAAAAISYGNGGNTTTTSSYSAPVPSTSGPKPPPKRKRAKKVPVDPLALTPSYAETNKPKAPKKAKGKAHQAADSAHSSRDTANRSVIVSPKTVLSHDYSTHSPALPVTVHLPSSMSSLPTFSQHQPYEQQRNVIVKMEGSDVIQEQQSLFLQQQHSHPNVIVYPKSKPFDPVHAQQHPHSVISTSHYYDTQQQQSTDGRCYQQGTPDVSLAPYYVNLMSSQNQSISPENSAPGSFESPSTSYVNVGMLPPVTRHSSARNSIDGPIDPSQYSTPPLYMPETLVNEAYPQFWSTPTAQTAPPSSQPYYVSTTVSDPGSRAIITAPSYIPPETTAPASSSNNTISNTSASSYYPDLSQTFDFNNINF